MSSDQLQQQLKVSADEEDRELKGAERAAVLLLALGESHGAPIWQKLDEIEVRQVSAAMANLGPVTPNMLEDLFKDFVRRVSSRGALTGNVDATERLLANFLPGEKVSIIMEEIRGPAGRNMWEKLSNVQENVLANYLKNEYPQTVAVVLSKIRADHAGRVLSLLPETFSMEVIMRMLRMEAVQKDVLEDVERTLRTEFMSNLARTARRDSHEMMADIFNNLERSVESKFLAALEERNRDSAEKIKALMFTFEDLNRLDPGAIQTLLRHIDKEKMPLALKGASEGLRDLFLSNMSERAGRLLRDDMEAMGPVRLKDVDEAQVGMVQVAKDLAASGEIVISDGKDDDLVY